MKSRAIPMMLMTAAMLSLPLLAHKAGTQTVLSASPNPASEGTLVALNATVTFTGSFGNGNSNGHPVPNETNGQPVVDNRINFEILMSGTEPVACDTPGAAFTAVPGTSHDDTDSSGVATVYFDTTGLAGYLIGFRALHPDSGGPHGAAQSASNCVDLLVLDGDALPDGTTTFTQGFYGASPIGEDVVDQLIDENTCGDIVSVLACEGISFEPALDCTQLDARAALSLFITGTVGPGRDDGFLPSGFEPGQNLAAQIITLYLNLNLAPVLAADQFAVQADYYLNIDPVQDVVGGLPGPMLDPLITTAANFPSEPGELGSCSDGDFDGVCDAGSVVLSALGEKVLSLDEAGTTVGEVLGAASALACSADGDVEVNGVLLTRGDLTAILGLINESFDEGIPTGFVTSIDID